MPEIRIALVSLGCAKNLVDSEMITANLKAENFELVTDLEEADAIIVNTCGFIETAKEESIEKLFEMAQYKQKNCRILLAAGCLAQRYGEELLAEIPEIDGIFGTNDLYAAAAAIRQALSGERPAYLCGEYASPEEAPRLLGTPGHTAYLKIAEGCDNCCTYCAIPAIRGPYRSRSPEAIIREAEDLAQLGVKELNLIAQDITYYGLDQEGRFTLPDLLKELNTIAQIEWIRLLYAYPERLDDRTIDSIANLNKVCHYIDLPLQHATDRILRQMGRRVTYGKIKRLIQKVRLRIPDIILRSSFIVGFPGETEQDFSKLLDFLYEAQLDRVGFFAYSQEEGTPAAAFAGQIPQEIKEKRVERALTAQSTIINDKQKALTTKTYRAIVDGRSAQNPDILLLRTYMQAPEVDGYVRVNAPQVKMGALVNVRITGYEGYDLLGKII